MGNTLSVPRDGGERPSDYLRRLFKDKTNNVDRLAAQALKEEQKRHKQAASKENGFWKQAKRRLKADDKHDRNDALLEEVDCNHNDIEAKGQCAHFNNKNKEFQKWRNHEENVIRSTRNAPPTTRGEEMPYGVTISFTPRRFLRSGQSPIFQFQIEPKFDWRTETSNRRDVRNMSNSKEMPWTHIDYGSDSWFDDSLALLADDTDDEIDTDSHKPCSLQKTDREKKTNDVERRVKDIEKSIDTIHAKWIAFQKKTSDFCHWFTTVSDDFMQMPLRSQDRGTNREFNNNRQRASTVNKDGFDIKDNRQSNTDRNAEAFPLTASDSSEFVTNDDKNSPKKIENGTESHQIPEVNQNKRDLKTAYIGLCRIGKYLIEQKNAAGGDGNDKLDMTSTSVTTLPERISIENIKLDEYPQISSSKQCGNCGLGDAKRATSSEEGQSNHMDFTTISTGNNDKIGVYSKAAESSMPFDADKVIVTEAMKYIGTKIDLNSDSNHERKIEVTGPTFKENFGDKFAKKTKELCASITDEIVSDKNKDRVEKTQTSTKQHEAFFVSLGSSANKDMSNTDAGKEHFENRFSSKPEKHSESKTENNCNINDNLKDNKNRDPIESNMDMTQTKNKADAFFELFGLSTFNSNDHAEDVKINFATRFQNKLKQNTVLTHDETPIKSSLITPFGCAKSPNTAADLHVLDNSSTEHRFLKRENKNPESAIQYHNQTKADNIIRTKKLETIQTKVDSWKTNSTNDNTPTQKPSKYGSVEHNNQIKRNNVMHKKKLDSIETTIDCWKTNEPDNSYLQPKMRGYELVPKQAEYGSVKHNNQIKKNNAMRKMKIGKIRTNLDTWNTPNPGSRYSLQRKDEWEPVLDHKKYGTAAHFHQTKGNDAKRKKRLDTIQTNLDTWNAPNPGSKYSLQRKDEWEPVLDHKKYGTAAHFHQIKGYNSMRQRRLNQIQSNIDTWNTPNPGSNYSLKRRDEWEPVLDTRKYGSVAHYHQVRGTHADNRYMIRKAGTRLNTWQPKSKMNLLHAKNEKTKYAVNHKKDLLNASVMSARPKIDTGTYRSIDLRQSNHSMPAWSRHNTDGGNRSFVPVWTGTRGSCSTPMPQGVPRQYQY